MGEKGARQAEDAVIGRAPPEARHVADTGAELAALERELELELGADFDLDRGRGRAPPPGPAFASTGRGFAGGSAGGSGAPAAHGAQPPRVKPVSFPMVSPLKARGGRDKASKSGRAGSPGSASTARTESARSEESDTEGSESTESGSDYTGSTESGSDYTGSTESGSDYTGSTESGSDYSGSTESGSDYSESGSDYSGSTESERSRRGRRGAGRRSGRGADDEIDALLTSIGAAPRRSRGSRSESGESDASDGSDASSRRHHKSRDRKGRKGHKDRRGYEDHGGYGGREGRRRDPLTDEQARRIQIEEVLGRSRGEQRTAFGLEREREMDQKASKLEYIAQLRLSLQEEGIDCKEIATPSLDSQMTEIDSVLNVLRLKNDRVRYSTIAEEVLLGLAQGLETVFDGSRALPVTGWRPDYTGYHNTLAVKLNRMRHETSEVVGNVVGNNKVNSVARIAMELVPSLLLYPNTRKRQRAAPSLADDPRVALNAMHSAESVVRAARHSDLDALRGI